jgi:pimeloyl-ACP methyl ester carboxylesterase
MQIGFRVVDGLQIRFTKNDTSSTQRIVLTSPWPESLLVFERVWPRLTAMARVTAVDLTGLGRSVGSAGFLSTRSARPSGAGGDHRHIA